VSGIDAANRDTLAEEGGMPDAWLDPGSRTTARMKEGGCLVTRGLNSDQIGHILISQEPT
jgi:hypothetical protein